MNRRRPIYGWRPSSDKHHAQGFRESINAARPHLTHWDHVIARRNPQQRRDILAERLAELRANPPKGYPQ